LKPRTNGSANVSYFQRVIGRGLCAASCFQVLASGGVNARVSGCVVMAGLRIVAGRVANSGNILKCARGAY
jgi:hypothetical protein